MPHAGCAGGVVGRHLGDQGQAITALDTQPADAGLLEGLLHDVLRAQGAAINFSSFSPRISCYYILFYLLYILTWHEQRHIKDFKDFFVMTDYNFSLM